MKILYLSPPFAIIFEDHLHPFHYLSIHLLDSLVIEHALLAQSHSSTKLSIDYKACKIFLKYYICMGYIENISQKSHWLIGRDFKRRLDCGGIIAVNSWFAVRKWGLSRKGRKAEKGLSSGDMTWKEISLSMAPLFSLCFVTWVAFLCQSLPPCTYCFRAGWLWSENMSQKKSLLL